jgi:hypothetical protein
MSDDTIVRFPTKTWQRILNRRGKRSVSCIVSDRWLRFHDDTHKMEEGTAILVDVMTDTSGEPRKLAQLCLTLEDLRKVLKNYD